MDILAEINRVMEDGGLAMKQPRNPFHPGEILLEEFLEPAGMTQAAFVKKLGWTRTRLNELIKGKRDMTADSALDLAKALGTSAKLWMNLQATYDLDQAAKRRKIA